MPYTPPLPGSIQFQFQTLYAPPGSGVIAFAFSEIEPEVPGMTARAYDCLAITISGSWVGPELSRFASQGFTTSNDDTPAAAAFLGRIVDDVAYSRSIGSQFWDSAGSRSLLGTLSMINSDGRLDSWGSEDMRNRIVTVYRGSVQAGELFTEWEVVAVGVIDNVDDATEERTDLILSDLSGLFDRPIQARLFDSGNTDNTALIGQLVPFCMGVSLSVPMILAELGGTNPYYQLHEAQPHSIQRVRSNGVELTPASQWAANLNGVDLLVAPEGRMVADVSGAKDSGGDLIERLPDVLRYLLVDRSPTGTGTGPLTEDQIDWDSVEALDTAAPYTLCYYADRPVTYRQVLTELLNSYLGYWYIDRLGRLAVGRLQLPAETADYEIAYSAVDGEAQMRRYGDRAPNYTNVVCAERNWYVHSPAEIANSLTDPVVLQIAYDLQADYRTRAAGDLAIDEQGGNTAVQLGGAVKNTGAATCLSDPADAATESERREALYADPKHFFRIPVLVEPTTALALEPGQTVRVTAPRFGLDAGRNLLLVSVAGRLLAGRVELILWG